MPKYGMMVSLAIGDTFGFSFEYASPNFVSKFNHPELGYVQHPKYEIINPGSYSDDTQMSIALAEMLLSDKPHTSMNLAMFFVRAFHRDPRTGYAKRFYELLKECTQNETAPIWISGTAVPAGAQRLLSRVEPHSIKSGGAMRAAPCGLLKEASDAVNTSLWQASLTHATRDGMDAAAAAALMVWACRHSCDVGYLPGFLTDWLPAHRANWETVWKKKVGSPGLESVQAALTALISHDNMLDILKHCISFIGDVDTVAAIALAAASQHPDIEQNLPEVLFDNLENGKYGRDYLISLDQQLQSKFPL